jgi:hypothetical protein
MKVHKPKNLMCVGQMSASEAYREGWERIFGKGGASRGDAEIAEKSASVSPCVGCLSSDPDCPRFCEPFQAWWRRGD